MAVVMEQHQQPVPHLRKLQTIRCSHFWIASPRWRCSGCGLSRLHRDRPVTAAKRPSEELDTFKIFSAMK